MNTSIYVPFVGDEVNIENIDFRQSSRPVLTSINEVRLESVDEIISLQEKVYKDILERRNSVKVLESYIRASILRAQYDAKPQLSYEYRDENLKLVGFVLSLVGDAQHTKSKRFVAPLSKYATHTACIYVSEWCVSRQTGIGGLLLKRFFSDYARFYLRENIGSAIVGDHRLSTSFVLIKRGMGLIEQIIKTTRPCDGINSFVSMQRVLGKVKVLGDEQRAVLLIPKFITM